MNTLLKPGEKLVQHRGLSAPICPAAELTQIVSNQHVHAKTTVIAGLCFAVLTGGELVLRYLGETSIDIKNEGEPNAVIRNDGSVFRGWWVHTQKIDGVTFGLLGRPNKRQYLGPRYEVPVPVHVSTRTWRDGLEMLPDFAKDHVKDLKAANSPRLAAAYDTSRSAIEAGYRLASLFAK